LYYKAEKLSALTDVSIYYYNSLLSQPSFNLQTKSHPIYTDIYNKMYPLGKKALYPNFVNQMDWASFAYLYMDDGSICDNGYGTPVLRIATQSFSYADNVLLQTRLQKLGCAVNVRKDTRPNGNVFWYLRLPAKSIAFFIDSIKPYINSCCQYKLISGVK
jgi:LAGLIDADG DNA endonuclease family